MRIETVTMALARVKNVCCYDVINTNIVDMNIEMRKEKKYV